MSEKIVVERQGPIAKLILNRPEAYNAFDMEMVSAFEREITLLTMDNKIRVVILTGSGKSFCAGGDLKWMLEYTHGPSVGLHSLVARFHHTIIEIRRMSKPVIAAINGVAAGGGFSLALACDFRIMAKSATLRQAYTSRGLTLDGGGSFTLPRLVGIARALEIVAFDKPITAEQALALGLVTKVVDDERLLDETMRMAQELSNISLNSFGWVKKLITNSFNTSLETQLEHERFAICSCASHEDGLEGLRAFMEKRKPVFNKLG